MLHPVGTLPPVVYWRRRILLLAPLLLIVLTIYVACSGGAGKPTSSPPQTPTPTPPPTTSAATSVSTATPTSSSRTTPTSTRPTSASPIACAKAALKIAAATGAGSYPVGRQPVLYLQVTNAGGVACVEDLSDPQIELLVYNGASRVWGSHDCQVQPGTSPQTLTVNQPVRRSITWSGLSSQPQCAGTRQRVGAGTYTLHAKLGRVEGTTAQFTITS